MARPGALELTADPTALAPERLLVFEVRGSIQEFAKAVNEIAGLDFIDEEELEGDEGDKAPVAYLLVPDAQAMEQILSSWKRWSAGRLDASKPWAKVFDLLRDLRTWGPDDRLSEEEQTFLEEEIEGRPDNDLILLEVELVFSDKPERAISYEAAVSDSILTYGGRIAHRAYVEDIAYHALLVSLPAVAVRSIVERSPESILGLNAVWHIRPQSLAPSIDIADPVTEPLRPGPVPEKPPILALLDGVPIARHPLLADRLEVLDLFELEPDTPVANRVHGTAMASLIVHGDRNRLEAPLPRRILALPVMGWDGRDEGLPKDRLIIDVMYRALYALHGPESIAPSVLIVNMSLGNRKRPFHGQMSPWGRLLDRLAWRFGVLFLVSAGNATDAFTVPAFAGSMEFEGADGTARARGVLSALNDKIAERRLISPAETLNGLTVGAANVDAVPAHERRTVGINVEPYPEHRMSNPSSRVGPGFARSIKPDFLMPGSREHLRIRASGGNMSVAPAGVARAFGLKVAAPPVDGNEATERYTNGTSAATALGSRTCHRIHDALEDAYGESFTALPRHRRAVLLKALMVHPARWPESSALLIRETLGPSDPKQHVRQKDNVRRFLGYGVLDPDDAVACAADRATFWAVGMLPSEQSAVVEIPIPTCIGGQARPHGLWATLAWFTPVQPGRRSYRSVRLNLLDPDHLATLAMKPAPAQPDHNQVRRGTVLSRRWEGNRAPAVTENMTVRLVVQRELDQGTPIDDPVPYGLAVTLSMPGVNEVYNQVRQRLTPRQRIR
ncbi:S8 family peptidase [Azospirillum lipoferum]|uniref:S8 family peptidase n=2 Tax=Azospirillaceae TaxID=2829815 RepID=A0A5A9GG78_AZOLI|nr:S8 family peptidase [Azospirillum lipoferum]